MKPYKLKFTILILALVLTNFNLKAQEVKSYFDKDNHKHLCGKFSCEILFEDTTYSTWFLKEYNSFVVEKKQYEWKKNLENVQVTIFLGTWCGDSRAWVPRFIKLWDALGLKHSQLTMVAVFDFSQSGKYKQSPTGEEKGKNIHRVPVFIFEKDNQEIARIVESPRNDLITDVAQIALGYPSKPNYKGANYLMYLLSDSMKVEFEKNKVKYSKDLQRQINSAGELNSLGYVYLESGKLEEALICFSLNIKFFPFDTNAYDSYAEALLKAGKKEQAIEMYERILLIDRNNEDAKKQINLLQVAPNKK